jgi:DNA polymerase III sliding clamp (beta) subunit (PCNA family)
MIYVNQSELLRVYLILSRVVLPKSTENPYYSSVLVESNTERLSFTATNGSVSIQVLLDCETDGVFRACVLGKFYGDLIKTLEGDLGLEFSDNCLIIHQDEKSSFRVNTLSPDLFPRLPHLNADGIELCSETLLDALSGVVWTADRQGVKLVVEEGTLEVSSIHGSSRAALYKTTIPESRNLDVILPVETARLLIEVLKQEGSENIFLASSGSTLSVIAGGVCFTSRILNQIPNIPMLFSQMHQWKMQAECDRKLLLSAIAPIAVYAQNQENDADKPVIRLQFRDDELALLDGRYENFAQKTIPIEFQGEIDIALDHSLLTSLLKSMKQDDMVVFHLKEKAPVFISHPEGGLTSQLCLLAPITIL